jgi:NitT/TauT family transport system substrate-binding protein
MKRIIGLAITLSFAAIVAGGARAENVVRVGFCAKTVTSAASPFAIANKMGWFANGAFKVELVPLAGSADCDKYVGTGELRYTLPSIEPLAALRPQGVKAKAFYTAYQGYTYGIAVPVASPIKSLKDLKGKKIGVASMASGGAVMVKAVVTNLGFADDVSIIAIGEGAQAAALTRSGEVDALGLYDVQYAIIGNLGVKLHIFPNPELDRFPGNGLVALDETLVQHRDEAVALAQGYAKGTIFAINNPEAAVRINWEVFPYTKSTGKDEATALRDDVTALEARIVNFKLDKAGVKNWGESNIANYQAYLDFLLKWGQIKQPIKAEEVVTNALLADIDKFDVDAVAKVAKAYKYK